MKSERANYERPVGKKTGARGRDEMVIGWAHSEGRPWPNPFVY